MGLEDFLRTPDGNVLKILFPSYEHADEFIMNNGLVEYGWTNQGTRKWCWEEEKNDMET